MADEIAQRIERNRLAALEKLRLKQLQAPQQPVVSFVAPAQQPAPQRTFAATSAPLQTTSINTVLMASRVAPNSLPSSSSAGSSKSAPAISFKQHVTVAFKLITAEKIEVRCGYHQELINAFKTIPSKSYDPLTQVWTFHVNHYNELVQQASRFPEIKLEPFPKLVMSFLKLCANAEKPAAVDLSNVEQNLVTKLLPFQRLGIEKAIGKFKGRLLLADDMGLGKTISALCISAYYRAEWPLLIISPSSLRFTWRDALLQWLPATVPPHHINVIEKRTGHTFAYPVTIISYDLLGSHVDAITQQGFRVVIADESHSIKNFKSERCKITQPLIAKATRAILLSGTPALSRPCELFPQISALDRAIFGNMHEFGLRYCNAKKTGFNGTWDYKGSSNLEELQCLLEARLMIRRRKADVMAELPSKVRKQVFLPPLSKAEMEKMSTKVIEVSRETADGGGGLPTMKAGAGPNKLLQLFHDTAVAKMKPVTEYIADLLESCDKFLVFAHHAVLLDAISEVLAKNKVDFMRIDGSTSIEARSRNVERFQNVDACRVAVLSITAANAGLTLTRAHTVVMAELNWHPGIMNQAEDRVHRIGQENSVVIHYLLCQGTADDFLWPMLASKLAVLAQCGVAKKTDLDTREKANFGGPAHKALSKEQALLRNFLSTVDLDSLFATDTGASQGPAEKKQKLF